MPKGKSDGESSGTDSPAATAQISSDDIFHLERASSRVQNLPSSTQRSARVAYRACIPTCHRGDEGLDTGRYMKGEIKRLYKTSGDKGVDTCEAHLLKGTLMPTLINTTLLTPTVLLKSTLLNTTLRLPGSTPSPLGSGPSLLTPRCLTTPSSRPLSSHSLYPYPPSPPIARPQAHTQARLAVPRPKSTSTYRLSSRGPPTLHHSRSFPSRLRRTACPSFSLEPHPSPRYRNQECGQPNALASSVTSYRALILPYAVLPLLVSACPRSFFSIAPTKEGTV